MLFDNFKVDPRPVTGLKSLTIFGSVKNSAARNWNSNMDLLNVGTIAIGLEVAEVVIGCVSESIDNAQQKKIEKRKERERKERERNPRTFEDFKSSGRYGWHNGMETL